MAIARAAVFTSAVTVTAGSTVQPTYPAGIQAGWLLYLPVLSKRGVTISTPSGWTLEPNAEKSGGAGADGSNSGIVKLTVFTRVADGSETGSVTVSFSGGTTNLVTARIAAYSNATGAWSLAAANGEDAAGGNSTWSCALNADPGITANDLMIATFACNTNIATHSAEALTVAGVTFGATTEFIDGGIASGDTVRLVVCEIPVSSGTSSAAGTFAGTASGNGTNWPAGPAVVMRLREVSNAAVVPLEANQLAGGLQSLMGGFQA